MSVRIVGQISLQEGTGDAAADRLVADLMASVDAVAELRAAHAGRNTEGSQGGGELTFDLLFDSDGDCASFLARSDKTPGLGLVAALGAGLQPHHACIENTDAVVVDALDRHVGSPGLVGVKRTLLLRVMEGVPAERTAAFERDMLGMPDAVPAMRNWSFGRVRLADPNPGPSRWTHVWEQEFETLAGLAEDYMLSPYHWGYIDPWYNPEQPGYIVDVWLAHVFCPASQSVLTWEA